MQKNEQRPKKETKSLKVSSDLKKSDIALLILDDHKPLKKLIRVLKDSEVDIDERRSAYAEFAPLLVEHAKPEEETLYVFMKGDKELRMEGFEGDVEHGIADQLLEEIKRTTDQDLWTAKVKVLAELVEHHIKEEESDLLPDFKKNSDLQERVQLGQLFLEKKTALLEKGGEDTVSEESDSTVRH